MSRGSTAIRVFDAIAKSAPEPLTWDQVAHRSGLARRPVQEAIRRGVKSQAIARTRRLDGRQGYAYTVAP